MNGKEIKQILKNNGINTKYISVKHSYCGYSESFDITIKSIDISILEVEQIVKTFERYERDERTGEILEGGNTYIFVAYDYDVLKEANEKYNQNVLDIINNELLSRTEEERRSWNRGDCNPVITLKDKLICYRFGSSIEIRDLTNSTTYRSNETHLAQTLIQMGLLKKVLGE